MKLTDPENDLLRTLLKEEPVHWDSIPAWVITSLFNWGLIEPVDDEDVLWSVTGRAEDCFG